MAIQQQIYQENIEVICKIDGGQWFMIEGMVELSRNEAADYVDFIITPSKDVVDSTDVNPANLKQNGGLVGTEFTLDIVNDIRTSGSQNQRRIFTGRLANLSRSVDAAWEGIAYDPTFATLEKGSNFMSQEIDFEQALQSYQDIGGSASPSGARVLNVATFAKPSDLMDILVKESGIGTDNFVNHLKDGGDTLAAEGGGSVRIGDDIVIAFSTSKMKVKDILARLEKSTNSEWWVDRFGKLHFGAITDDTAVDAYDLQFIIDSSAGLTTPAYRSVRVIGSGVVSEDGWNKQALNQSTALKISKNISDDEIDSDKLAEPTFEYKNMQIETQQEADNARQKIVDNIKKQQAEGKITVTGFPDVRPLDVVKMPNEAPQKFGGDKYGVYKVVHKIGAGDGFKTDIHVEGLSLSQTTFLSDVQEPDISGFPTLSGDSDDDGSSVLAGGDLS